MLTIKLDQLAHAVNTRTRLVPIHIVHCTILGEESWLIHTMKEPVKMLYPCRWYTSQQALAAFCEENNIDIQNVITEIEEEN